MDAGGGRRMSLSFEGYTLWWGCDSSKTESHEMKGPEELKFRAFLFDQDTF